MKEVEDLFLQGPKVLMLSSNLYRTSIWGSKGA